MKNLFPVFLALLAISAIAFSCDRGDDDDDDNDESELGACCNAWDYCLYCERKVCSSPSSRWLGDKYSCFPNPCEGDYTKDHGACCDADDQCQNILKEECNWINGRWLGSSISCTPELCEDPQDECEHNTAPVLEETIWVVGDNQEPYPETATATTDDTFGVSFAWSDTECNLAGGYSTLSMVINGMTDEPIELGPYTDGMGCSTEDSGNYIGFLINGTPIYTGMCDWTFSATDACNATSIEKTGTFTITEPDKQ